MNKITKVLLLSVVVDFLGAVLKIFGGVIGYSKTLVADGVRSLSDLGPGLFALLKNKIINKSSDDQPFSYGKIENLVSMSIGIIIIFIGLFLLKNTFTKELTIPSLWLVLILIIVIMLKIYLLFYIYKKEEEYNSKLLREISKKRKIDIYYSFITLVMIIIVQFYKNFSILEYLDTAGGIIISTLIIYVGINIIKEETNNLIGKKEEDIEINKHIKSIIKNNKSVIGVKEINMIKYGVNYLAIIDVYLKSNIKFNKVNEIRNKLEKEIKNDIRKIAFIAIRVIPKEDSNARVTRSRNSKKNTRKQTKE